MVEGTLTLHTSTSTIGPFDVLFVLQPNELHGWKYKGVDHTGRGDTFNFTGMRPKTKMIFRLARKEQDSWLRSALIKQEDYSITQINIKNGKTKDDPF